MSEDFSKLRIAVIGSCQGVGISQTLKRVMPGATICHWHPEVLSISEKEEVLASLPSFDHVITQIPLKFDSNSEIASVQTKNNQFATIHEKCPSVLFIPVFVFNGFTPDFQNIHFAPDLRSPLQNLHSIVIAAAYAFQISQHRLKRLLNPILFRELGFYEQYLWEKQNLFSTFSKAGFDLTQHFLEWSKSPGLFMHCMVHPKKEVLARLALICGEKLSLINSSTSIPDDLPDSLAGSLILPTYPAYAESLGCKSEGEVQLVPEAPYNNKHRFTLDEFISANYQSYSAYPNELFIKKLPAHVVAAFERLLGEEKKISRPLVDARLLRAKPGFYDSQNTAT